MPEEIEPSGEESAGQKQRRKRPEIQIYRPGTELFKSNSRGFHPLSTRFPYSKSISHSRICIPHPVSAQDILYKRAESGCGCQILGTGHKSVEMLPNLMKSLFFPGMMKHGAPRERREHPDDASDAGSESGRPHSTYDSTQSLYTNRIPDSYLNFRRNDRLGGSARSYGQKFNRVGN